MQQQHFFSVLYYMCVWMCSISFIIPSFSHIDFFLRCDYSKEYFLNLFSSNVRLCQTGIKNKVKIILKNLERKIWLAEGWIHHLGQQWSLSQK